MSEDAAVEVDIPDGIVVADDGSDHARLALEWAVEEARLRRCTLHVVRAWSIQTAPRPATWRPGYAPSLKEYEEAVRAELQRDVREALGDDPGCHVAVHPVHAHPGRALVAASQHADLVVVGSRGMGGIRGMLLGSVSEQVVRHANCSVVVVRRRRKDQQAG
jgi:nucleotide-binding universal stress UspA family protein